VFVIGTIYMLSSNKRKTAAANGGEARLMGNRTAAK